jgi:hypothetical protein
MRWRSPPDPRGALADRYGRRLPFMTRRRPSPRRPCSAGLPGASPCSTSRGRRRIGGAAVRDGTQLIGHEYRRAGTIRRPHRLGCDGRCCGRKRAARRRHPD